VRRGIVKPSVEGLDLKRLAGIPVPEPVCGGDILAALLADRD
jgi:hypothetical protein